MQAFFAAKSEFFFFFSEGAPPKPRAVPAAAKRPPCPLPAAEDHAPPCALSAGATARLFLKTGKKFPSFVTKRSMGSLIYEDTRKERR